MNIYIYVFANTFRFQREYNILYNFLCMRVFAIYLQQHANAIVPYSFKCKT